MRDGGRRVPRLTSSGLHDTTTEEDEPSGSEAGPRPAEQPPRRRHWAPHVPRHRWSRLVAAALIVVLIPIGWSLGHALTMTGGGSTSERVAEWARDHYLGPLVTLGEWISYSPPKTCGKPSFALTGPSAAVRAHRQAASGHHPSAPSYPAPPALASMAGKPLPGEGKWRVLGTVGGVPAMYGTYLRPSAVYSSYVAGIVAMNQSLLRFELRPGAEDPGPGPWKAATYIAPGTRRGLLATFNGGFKINESGGGFYLNGATDGTLTRGTASLVYYRDGRVAIGNWDQTVRMTPDVAGVRQNLHLIVAHGRVPSAVDDNVESSWGATLGGGYYVWRSGIGMTNDGRVIFAYGPALNVRELAEVLRHAGAVTAMQLDINPDWMSFMYYLHDESSHSRPVNLLPDQVQPPDRYYTPASRDFTAVYAR